MYGHEQNGYGLWVLVILNSAVFIIFAFSFTRPKSKTDWRSLGAFSAFILALFTEMYGFPLTIYLLSGWLGQKFAGLNLFSHNNGHLWETLLGSKIDPHLHPIHIAANIFIILGFWLLASAWKVLHTAQKNNQLATTGVYSKIRHPQYIGFIAIMFGFLLMWPTLLTLIMFPILVYMYYRLAKKEERDMEIEFSQEYRQYEKKTPRFVPHLKELFNEQPKT